MTIHIATSQELGRVVRRGLRETVRFVPDNLLVGPCARDAQAHVRARCDYWGLQRRERTRFLTSFNDVLAALESRGRVVVWTSRLWLDTIAFWALCAWRLAARREELGVDVVVLGEPAGDDAPGFGPQYIRVQPADARRGVETIRSLSATRARQMAVSWRRLAGPSPILATAGRQPPSPRQVLSALGAYQAGFFPRQGERGPALSRFDELLFSCLGDQCSTPVDVFVHRGAAGEELRKWLSLTGDVFLASRLAHWASHGGERAALRGEAHQSGNVMTAARYKLTELGRVIQRHGLGSLDQGAPLPMWGVTAYDPGAPWLVIERLAERLSLQRVERSTQKTRG